MTFNEYQEWIQENPLALAYVSGEGCAVCHSLKPKIRELIKDRFPKMAWLEIKREDSPEVPAQLGIFSIPAVIVYFDHKESFRLARNFSLLEIEQKLERPYQLLTQL